MRLNKLGATLGLGVATMNLNEMNNRLQELGIGSLEEDQNWYNFSIYIEFNSGFGISMDISGGISLESELYNPDTWITLKALSFGPTLYYPFVKTNRIRLSVLGELRTYDMKFEYNANANAIPDLNNLLTNPAANSNTVILESTSTDAVTLGARFQYRLGKKENLKPREYSLGIDIGYNYGFGSVAWHEIRSKYAINDMPAIKPDNFYFNFTFTALLIR
ncbi:hypothetical protein ACFSKU_10450 [Pontibacter silvestris]|uniref:Outer membrane protein beta-barrel domain-containing protein n=2 Tax=Pontibacter silvestris TaxID=2305183 RepID=A0ABW4WYK2_9BACT